MINEKEVIKALQDQRTKDPVLDAVCTVFAARQRARDRVTMQALRERMKKEGFLYADADYARILKLLGTLGLGRIHADHKGRVIALSDIKVTLQSVGMAAVGQATVMDRHWKRNKFQKIPVIEAAPIRKEPTKVVEKVEETLTLQRVQPRPAPGVWEVLCVPMRDGSTFKTYVPENLTKEDAVLIGKALAGMAKAAS